MSEAHEEPGTHGDSRDDEEVIARVVRWSLGAAAVLAVVVVAAWMLLPRGPVESFEAQAEISLPERRRQASVVAPKFKFTEIASVAGIDFIHENRLSGDKLLPETMGGGCAFFDYDGDGDQDLALVDSNRWPHEPASPDRPSIRLFLNDGDGNFSDATADAGIELSCYGMGVAVGDYDNDGDADVFVTAVGKNALLRNEGGRFVDVSAEVGVEGANDAWSTSAGFFDYDNDGDLDLFVGNYVTWSPQLDLDQDFRLTGLGRAYGPPRSFAGSQPYLYRNDGAAGFAEVSKEAGLHENAPASEAGLAKSLGVHPCDVNHDGWMDLVIANDTVRNQQFLNNGDGTFTEAGVVTGLAYDMDGKARGAMGIDAAPLGEDGELAIAIGNFANEMTAFYFSDDHGKLFTDDAVPIGIGPQTRLDLTFGLFFFDADLDGRLDLFSANGHIEDEINRVQASQHYRQPPSLFWNAAQSGGTEFLRINGAGDLQRPLVGRGASYADIDGDGDLDVLVTQVKGPPALLRNDLESRPHFLRLKLVGTDANRDAIGARITVTLGNRKVVACVAPTRSYLSQVELPVTIGLGASDSVDRIEITWPGGQRQVVDSVQLDREIIVKQPTQ